MFIYFNQNVNRYRKGQLAPFFIIIIVVILIASLISINIGKIAQQKTYTGDSSDAGALAAASVLAYAFNYVAKANEYFEGNYNRFRSEAFIHFKVGWEKLFIAQEQSRKARNAVCQQSTGGGENPCTAVRYIENAIEFLRMYNAEMNMLRNVIIPNFYNYEKNFYKQVRRVVHRDERHQNDLYNQALVAGYKILFLNSGTAVKLFEGWKSRFYNWINSIGYWNVENLKAEIFPQPIGTTAGPHFWTDREGREHKAWGQVGIEPIRKYEIRHTKLTYNEEINRLSYAIDEADRANLWLWDAHRAAVLACSFFLCWLASGKINMQCYNKFKAWCQVATRDLTEALNHMNKSYEYSQEAWKGLDIETAYTTLSLSEDLYNLIICWIDDIIHGRITQTYSRQIHEGSGKGTSPSQDLWKTQYPITHGSTETTFNYQDRGHICSVHDGTTCKPVKKHDAAITNVDFTDTWLSATW